MTAQKTIVKAQLWELDPQGQQLRDKNSPVTVQFNPETLKVSFANQVVPPQGGAKDQSDTSTTQYVGKGTTKLSVQLWFDVSAKLPIGMPQEAAAKDGVRRLTEKVAYFITPKPAPDDPEKRVPPAIRFSWGTFQFDGIMESMEESLEYFSPDGVPLRASLTINLSQQSIQFAFPDRKAPGAKQPGGASLPSGAPPGTRPLTQAPAGSSLQSMVDGRGGGRSWQEVAAANEIENPRMLQPGQLIDLNR